ncbi:FliI/YscN family ATPase [Vibrio sp. TBV020]|uniref:FliI/YscN family ATPase n=1 Tax=Vibrio sp. TBV020 TaxID=3137398 RepID=UPI0038CD288F
MSEETELYLVELDFTPRLDELERKFSFEVELQEAGKVVAITSNIIKAQMPNASIGNMCLLRTPEQPDLYAEVIAIQSPYTLLVPLGDSRGLSNFTRVVNTQRQHEIKVGAHLLGTVLDGLGRPITSISGNDLSIDVRSKRNKELVRSVFQQAPDPMTRPPINTPLSLGVRAIDTMLTMGIGQRMGIFAAAGGGKSTLLSMIISNTEADVIVLALVGERGREVREFIEVHMDEVTRQKSVLVIATSDRPSMERARAANIATTIAEYFREVGHNVLLMIDSITRYARALREIGLAAGEPPTRRGYPPSVFEQLPLLLERPGLTETGAISALYTVLVEGDDMNEPVSDEVRSILDGHIVLSKELAASAHYPAIDVLRSTSRVMSQITSDHHLMAANQIRSWMAAYETNELLIKLGEYQVGSDKNLDTAITKRPFINSLLQQGINESSSFSDSKEQLEEIGIN